MPPRISLPTITAAAVAALSLAGAAPAAADSIAYVEDGDVWLSTADGARQAQVTRTGDNAYVSQADDGTMVALAPNERLRTLGRDGTVKAEYPTFVSDGAPVSGPVNQFAGPFAPEVSPDGKLVAFEWFNRSYDSDPECSETSSPPCAVLHSSQGVGVSRTDGFTGFEEYGLMTGWIGPQWLSSSKLMRSFANSTQTEDAVFNDVAPGRGDKDMDRWFYDETGGILYEAELSRDRRVVAAIAGFGDEELRIYRPVMEPFGAPDPDMGAFADRPALVERCAALTPPAGGKFESLSLSPDGRRLAYGTSEGIRVTDVPDLAAGCGPVGPGTLVAAGGRFPHFGPADVPAGSAAPAGPTGGSGAAARLGLRAPKAIPLREARRRGIPVRARTASAGRVTATALARGRRAGRARGRAKTAGTVKLRVKLGRRARAGRVKLTVAFRPQGGGAVQRAAATVRVRR